MQQHSSENHRQLCELDTALAEAYNTFDEGRLQALQTQFQEPALAELRSGEEQWKRVERALDLGAPAAAAAIWSETIELFIAARSLKLPIRWWNPEQEAEEFSRRCFSRPELANEPVFTDAVRTLLAWERTRMKEVDVEVFVGSMQLAANRLSLYTRTYGYFSAHGTSQPELESLLGLDLVSLARKQFEIMELAYQEDIVQADTFRPLYDFEPLAEAAATLSRLPGCADELRIICARHVERVDENLAYAKAATLLLHRAYRELSKDDLKLQELISELFDTLLSQELGSEGPRIVPGETAGLIPLIADEKMLHERCAQLSLAVANEAIIEWQDLDDPLPDEEDEDAGDYDLEFTPDAEEAEDEESFESIAEFDPEASDESEVAGMGRHLSTISFEDFPFYRLAPALRPLAEGRFHHEDLSFGFADDHELLSGSDRQFTPDPVRALRIALGILFAESPEVTEATDDEIEAGLQNPEFRIALRPTREDVDEPYCFTDLMLTCLEGLAESSHAEDARLTSVLAAALERGQIVLAKNIWWDPVTKQKAYEQGLALEEQRRHRAAAEESAGGHLQVAEELDAEQTKLLTAALRGEARFKRTRLDSEPADDLVSSAAAERDSFIAGALRNLSPQEFKALHEQLYNIVRTGTVAGLSFSVYSTGYGFHPRAGRQGVLIVQLTEGTPELCRNLAIELAKLIPAPITVRGTPASELQ